MGIDTRRSICLFSDAGSAGERDLARLTAVAEPSTAGGWFDTLGQWIRGLLTLDGDTFQATIASENGLWWALALFLTAGVSVAIGQSIVLFSNRVPGSRFTISLLGSGAVGLLAVLFWSVSIWATARLLFGVTEPWRSFLIVTALGFAPALFGFALFMPYLGVIFGWILRVWVANKIGCAPKGPPGGALRNTCLPSFPLPEDHRNLILLAIDYARFSSRDRIKAVSIRISYMIGSPSGHPPP